MAVGVESTRQSGRAAWQSGRGLAWVRAWRAEGPPVPHARTKTRPTCMFVFQLYHSWPSNVNKKD